MKVGSFSLKETMYSEFPLIRLICHTNKKGLTNELVLIADLHWNKLLWPEIGGLDNWLVLIVELLITGFFCLCKRLYIILIP